jgi:tRNA 2-selenouridine synthase SelU
MGAPSFTGSPVQRSLNEWFDVSLRENLPVIARKRGAAAYIGVLEREVENAYQLYEAGDVEGGRDVMVTLLDLIHVHLHLPSKKEIGELRERTRGLH